MVTIENLGNILMILIAVVSALLIILIIIEKKLHKKIIKTKESRNVFYIKKISKVDKPDSKNTLTNLNKITREFFIEAFKIEPGADYLKLEKFFNQQNNIEVAEFCGLMNDALYSGKRNKKEDIKGLILSLAGIVQRTPLSTGEELKIKEP